MAITYVGNTAALATNTTTVTLGIAAPTLQNGDIMIAILVNKSATLNTISPPDGTWSTVIAQEVNDCTTAADDHQYVVFWKRASSGDSGATFNFTKATDDNVLFTGVIAVWRGAVSTGNALDPTAAARTETVGAADNVSFPAYDPTRTQVHVIFIAIYGNDQTTFNAAMSNDTNPDCTVRFDLETGQGNDCSIAVCSGENDGSNIAARTWASGSSTDAGNTGIVFALWYPTDMPLTLSDDINS